MQKLHAKKLRHASEFLPGAAALELHCGDKTCVALGGEWTQLTSQLAVPKHALDATGQWGPQPLLLACPLIIFAGSC